MTADLAIRDEQHYLTTIAEVRTLALRCETVGDAKSLADQARTAQVWAQRAKLGTEQVNLAAAAKLWAERRAGELLREAPKNTGARPDGRSRMATADETPTLSDLGVTKHESSRWQALAAIPETDFADAVEKARDEGSVSAARVSRIADAAVNGRMRAAVFPSTPVFDAFWKASHLLIQKARPDFADDEQWDAETRDLIRRWAPMMIERILQLADLVELPAQLTAVEGGRRGDS